MGIVQAALNAPDNTATPFGLVEKLLPNGHQDDGGAAGRADGPGAARYR